MGFFVSTADSSLKDMREKNIEADIRKNILSSLGCKETLESPWTNERVEEIFSESIIGFVVDSAGSVIDGKNPKDINSDIDVKEFPI